MIFDVGIGEEYGGLLAKLAVGYFEEDEQNFIIGRSCFEQGLKIASDS